MDWLDHKHSHRLVTTMVSQTNLDSPIGQLDGVITDQSSITASYYTDSRTSASLAYVGDGWKRGSLIRLTYEIPEWNYKRELGTYHATQDPAQRQNGQWHTTLELHSMLHALSRDVAKPMTLAKGASALAATKQILSAAKRAYVAPKAKDAKLKEPLVLESGTDQLKRLFALSKACDNRLDVDSHGRILVDPYQAPYAKTPVLSIDLGDPRGVALDGISRNSNWLEMPNRAYVSYKYSAEVNKGGKKKTEQREIVEYADATGSRSPSAVGWVITDVHSLSEMSPQTAARAQQLAKEYLQNDSYEHVEWELNTTYLPIWEGDVVELVVRDGPERYRGKRKCLVKNLELELQHFTMRLTLKEVRPYDDEKEEE